MRYSMEDFDPRVRKIFLNLSFLTEYYFSMFQLLVSSSPQRQRSAAGSYATSRELHMRNPTILTSGTFLRILMYAPSSVFLKRTEGSIHRRQDVDCWQSSILITEETLLEALCFEFVVESPHVEMLNMFESLQPGIELQEYAWSVTHDA